MERIQQLRAALGEEMCIEIAQFVPSEMQLASWESRLSRLDRIQGLVARTTGSPTPIESPRFARQESNRSRAIERLQQLRAEVAREIRTTLAKRLPSGAQVERWEERLGKLDRLRALVDESARPPRS